MKEEEGKKKIKLSNNKATEREDTEGKVFTSIRRGTKSINHYWVPSSITPFMYF